MATATKPRTRARADEPKGRKARAAAKAKERNRKLQAKAGNRWRTYYDTDGPRVRLGILWFVGALVALVAGTIVTAVYFGLASGAASSHALRTWRARGHRLDPIVGLVASASVVAAAAVSPQAMGAAVLVMAVAVMVVAYRSVEANASGAVGLARSGVYLQAILPTAVAGGCFVLLRDQEIWAALSLLALVSAYEVGDYIVGSGGTSLFEGPIAGLAAVAVTTLLVASLAFRPFETSEAIVFGLLVAPLAMAGQYVGSAMLPHSRSFAPALRRVDSMLVAAPFWYFGISFLLT